MKVSNSIFDIQMKTFRKILGVAVVVAMAVAKPVPAPAPVPAAFTGCKCKSLRNVCLDVAFIAFEHIKSHRF